MTASAMVGRAGLEVAEVLVDFVERQALPGTGLNALTFWDAAADIFARFAPESRRLLSVRAEMQAAIDDRYAAGQEVDEGFLRSIGYLVPEPPPFHVSPGDIDPEVATLAGPQLVVPALNRRFVLNAANARWGSLFDALYGTDVLPGRPAPGGYDATRGAQVIARAQAFLDEAAPLATGGWADFDGSGPHLRDPAQLVGRRGEHLLLRHNGLHIEVIVDRDHPVARGHRWGVADVVLEAALTTIVDLEDSIAAVDADDKVAAYGAWLGLMRGDLEETFEKGGRTLTRRLEEDRSYVGCDGAPYILPGRSLLLVRNVGRLMTTPAVRLADGSEAPEGVLDAIVTSLIGLHDLAGLGRHRNSRAGSIYVVVPKTHGPAEADFTHRLFGAVEDLLGVPRHTIKVGLMDEERRTSANLAACIHALRERLFFINTGFLDRTGDEIHTAMRGGAVIRKGDMRTAEWMRAYEQRNVAIGLACGLSRRAQIGKGMWAAPDSMAEMLEQKIAHPLAGATTAWVPSPTAATLHALHYHKIDVFERQDALAGEPIPPLGPLLNAPFAHGARWTAAEIRDELETNVQAILGYVVRWIDQGVGCSKVPDLRDVGLMEDRATLRISAQHIANWLWHGVVDEAQVEAVFQAMALKVDAQNAADPLYRAMAEQPGGGIAYEAARALVFQGAAQPSGYTEPLLHRFRLAAKRRT